MTRDELIRDKERIDKYSTKIAKQEFVMEWKVIYALLVAVGHILEWLAGTKRTDVTKG